MIIRHIISVALTGSLALACVGAGAAASADASTFPVYDNTFYSNVNLEQVGAVKSNVIYEAPVAQLSGQNPNSFRGPRPRGAELALPAKSAYEAYIQRTASHPGPVVLDFETLYLKGSRPSPDGTIEKLRTLLDWAHEAVPGVRSATTACPATPFRATSSWSGASPSARTPCSRAFTRSPTTSPAWRTRFRHVMSEAAAVAPGKPVYAYLWPQYHDGTKLAGRYLTPDHWRYELETAQQLCSGVVIWSPWSSDPDQRWVDETAAFLGGTTAAQHAPST